MFSKIKNFFRKGDNVDLINTPANPENPQSPKVGFFKTHLHKLMILALVVLFILVAISIPKSDKLKDLNPRYLSIVSFSPKYSINNPYEPIIIVFNQPISAHHIQEFFQISPYSEGILEPGDSEKTVRFTPKTGWIPGSYIQVVLKKGLPSDNGKRLIQDLTYSFSVNESANSISFKNSELMGKFMSFDQSLGAKITMSVGSKLGGENKVKIFKVTPEVMLNSFVYSVDAESGSYPLSGSYLEKEVDTSKLELVDEYQISNNQEINFKGNVGLYLFQALSGDKVINTAWIALNKIGIHFRQDDQSVFLAAQNLSTKEPESGLDVKFYKLDKTPTVLAQHGLTSIQEYPLSYSSRLDLVVATKGSDVAIVPVQIPNSQAEIRRYQDLNSKHQIFIYTDRPIYKAGDKVSYRGIVRVDNDAQYKTPPAGKKIRVYISTYSQIGPKYIVDQTVELKEGGIFSGEFEISSDLSKLGTIYLYATENIEKTENYSSAYAYFDVFEYIKPDFGLDVEIEKGEYIRGDVIKATLSGKYFNGQPLSNKTVSYSIYRRDYYETEKAVYNQSFKLNGWGGMCGGGGSQDEYYGEPIVEKNQVTLDQNGQARIEFPSKQLDQILSQQITVLVERENDKAPKPAGTPIPYYADYTSRRIVAAKNTLVHQGEYNIFLRPGPNSVQSGDEMIATFYTESLAGQIVGNATLNYELYEEKYNDSNSYSREIIKQGTTTTNAEGVGIIKDSIKSDNGRGVYLAINGKDQRGNSIEGRKYIYIAPPSDTTYSKYGAWSDASRQVQLKITSSKSNLTVGNQASLEIIAPQDLEVFASFERGRVYKPQWLDLKKGTNTYTFDVPSEFMPSITPTFSFFLDGEYYIEGLSLNVPAMQKLITVEVSTDKEKYAPGDTALVTVLTKDNGGNLISANVGLGIVDKAIFALRKNAALPIHSSFYFYRPRSTNSSSSLTWIGAYGGGGGGGGGGDGALFQKDADTLYWNPNLKTGSDGRLIIPVPVGSSQTTWKILTYSSTDDSKFGQGDKDFLVAP